VFLSRGRRAAWSKRSDLTDGTLRSVSVLVDDATRGRELGVSVRTHALAVVVEAQPPDVLEARPPDVVSGHIIDGGMSTVSIR
jgi:hypothetical protein